MGFFAKRKAKKQAEHKKAMEEFWADTTHRYDLDQDPNPDIWRSDIVTLGEPTEAPSIQTNIINNEDFQAYAEATLSKISEALTKSLGYYGSTTILEDPFMKDTITKDGYTILGNIKFNNSISVTILGLIKDISGNLVRTVGDGSTSSVVAANYLYHNLVEEMEKKDSPLYNKSAKEIFDAMQEIEEAIDDEIDKISKPITEDNMEVIKNIATVSNNNDSKSGNIIYDIYKECGLGTMIFLDETTDGEDSYEVHKGLTIDRGYVDPVFANRANQVDADFDDANVLLFRNGLKKKDADNWLVDLIGKIFSSTNSPLIFVASSFSNEVINAMKNNIKMNQRRDIQIPIALVTYPTNRDDYNDLAAYLGADIMDSDDPSTQAGSFNDIINGVRTDPGLFLATTVGHAGHVHIDGNTTSFIDGHGPKAKLDAQIKSLQGQIKIGKSQTPDETTRNEIYKLEKRVANLNGQIATLYVGGSTTREQQTRKYLLDDAVNATESAIKNGYIPGGNLTVSKILYTYDGFKNDPMKKCLADLISDSMKSVYCQVLLNSNQTTPIKAAETTASLVKSKSLYNLKTGDIETDEHTSIINSAETDKMILKSILSIIGLLATSNQYLAKDAKYDD